MRSIFGATLFIKNSTKETIKVLPIESRSDEYVGYSQFKYLIGPGEVKQHKSGKLGLSSIKGIRWARAYMNSYLNKMIYLYCYVDFGALSVSFNDTAVFNIETVPGDKPEGIRYRYQKNKHSKEIEGRAVIIKNVLQLDTATKTWKIDSGTDLGKEEDWVLVNTK